MTFGPVLDAALAAQATCESLDLPSCVIGGVDLDLVRAELRPLVEAKEAPGILQELERRVARQFDDTSGTC